MLGEIEERPEVQCSSDQTGGDPPSAEMFLLVCDGGTELVAGISQGTLTWLGTMLAQHPTRQPGGRGSLPQKQDAFYF